MQPPGSDSADRAEAEVVPDSVEEAEVVVVAAEEAVEDAVVAAHEVRDAELSTASSIISVIAGERSRSTPDQCSSNSIIRR
jgi:hypothetical protein